MYQAQELVVVQKSFSQGPLGKLCKPPSHRIVALGETPRNRKYLTKKLVYHFAKFGVSFQKHYLFEEFLTY